MMLSAIMYEVEFKFIFFSQISADNSRRFSLIFFYCLYSLFQYPRFFCALFRDIRVKLLFHVMRQTPLLEELRNSNIELML